MENDKCSAEEKLQRIPLEKTLNSLLESIEQQEKWLVLEREFRRKLKSFHILLSERESRMDTGRMVQDFVSMSAYTGFRDTVELLRALSWHNDNTLRHVLERGMAGRNEDDPAWWLLRMRLAYLARSNALTRVFSEERAQMIERCLEIYQSRLSSRTQDSASKQN